jgi:ElaB/YqjD/DUF883 family membrane-anchored ribosome-binding protein
MDPNNREPGANVSRAINAASDTAEDIRRNVSDKADQARASLNDFKRKAHDKLDGSRRKTANALEWTATNLHSRADRVSGFTHTTADRLQDTAKYFRESEIEDIVDDVEDAVRRHPGRSLAAAAILGFLVALGLRRSIG